MTNVTYRSQKSLAADLDRAADLAGMGGGSPATSKQTWYLAGLLIQKISADYQWSATDALTKREASEWIDRLLRLEDEVESEVNDQPWVEVDEYGRELICENC